MEFRISLLELDKAAVLVFTCFYFFSRDYLTSALLVFMMSFSDDVLRNNPVSYTFQLSVLTKRTACLSRRAGNFVFNKLAVCDLYLK